MIDAAGLRIVKAIAEEGSFTGAATALGYTQPAISQMIRRLEQRLGTALVQRIGRHVRLTEAGEVLARHAATVLAALDAAEEEVAAIAGLRSGRVRLMAFPSSSAALVPRALALLKKRFPDVSVRFSEAEPPESLAALRAGECDLAVAFTYDGTDVGRGEEIEPLVLRPLLEEEVRLAVPTDHRFARDDVVDLREAADEAWIAGCPRCRGHLMALGKQAGFTPNVAFETEDYVAVLGLVRSGLGVALVPDMILQAAHEDGVATPRLVQCSHRQIHAVTTEDLLRVPAVAAMLAALEDSAGGMSSGCRAPAADSSRVPSLAGAAQDAPTGK